MIGRRPGSIPRSAALIALAVLAVHQLRYLLAYGSGAHDELLRQGHAYMFQALPVLISFASAALAAGLVRAILRPRPQGRPGRAETAAPSLLLRALLYAISIVVVFTIQETAEGLLFAGHAAGVAAVLGGGGWLSLPLAALFGFLCGALDGGLARLEALAARAESRLSQPKASSPDRIVVSRSPVPLASLPLAFGLARRPPPAAL